MSNDMKVYHNRVAADDSAPGEPGVAVVLLLLRLAVGGALEGADELLRRLQERQETLNQSRAANITVVPRAGVETELERLRYALVGLLFETPGAVARGLSTTRHNTQQAVNLVAKVTRPVTNSWLARPARRRYEKLAARREAFIDRLVAVGRNEEQHGRLLARNITDETLDEVLAYLAQKPELREIVQQQGVSLTEEVVNGLRQRSAAADRLIDRILGRSPQTSSLTVVDVPTANSKRHTQ